METPQTLEDFVFENRNQQYGAYDIRHSYQTHARLAVVAGVLIFVCGAFSPVIFSRRISDTEKEVSGKLLTQKIETPEPIKPAPELPPPPPVESQPVNSYEFKKPEIVVDEQVPDDSFLATQEQLMEHQAGQQTVLDGTDAPVLIDLEPSTGKKVETVVEIKPTDEDQPVLMVEQQPEFPGGMEALSRFLRQNLKYPAQAQQGSISGKVFLSFVIDKDGSLSRIEVEKGLGFGCDEEAIRVLRNMPRWKPGRQQGRAVKVRFHLPITFVLE